MTYLWPSLQAEDLFSGEGAKTTGQELFDQQQALKPGRRQTLHFAEQQTNSTSFVTLHSEPYWVPDWAEAGEVIRLYLRGRKNTGGDAEFRFGIGGTWSNTVVESSATFVVLPVMKLTIDAAWPGTLRTIDIDARKPDGNNAYITGEQVLGNLYVEED